MEEEIEKEAEVVANRETPNKRSQRLLDQTGGSEAELGETTLLALTRKSNSSLGKPDVLSIFNLIPNSLLLYIASICHIETSENQINKREYLKVYRKRSIREDTK